jgi:hypothetical protein
MQDRKRTSEVLRGLDLLGIGHFYCNKEERKDRKRKVMTMMEGKGQVKGKAVKKRFGLGLALWPRLSPVTREFPKIRKTPSLVSLQTDVTRLIYTYDNMNHLASHSPN